MASSVQKALQRWIPVASPLDLRNPKLVLRQRQVGNELAKVRFAPDAIPPPGLAELGLVGGRGVAMIRRLPGQHINDAAHKANPTPAGCELPWLGARQPPGGAPARRGAGADPFHLPCGGNPASVPVAAANCIPSASVVALVYICCPP